MYPSACLNSERELSQSPLARRPGSKAFSLIEILIVIGLIAALAAVMIANLDRIFGGGQEEVAKIFVKQTIQAPLTAYKLHMRSYPTTEQGLQALLTAPAGAGDRWKGPYLTEDPIDPWGNAYQYRYPGVKNPSGYDIWSLGPDKVDSDQNIGNW